jgi:hypothetical protein
MFLSAGTNNRKLRTTNAVTPYRTRSRGSACHACKQPIPGTQMESTEIVLRADLACLGRWRSRREWSQALKPRGWWHRRACALWQQLTCPPKQGPQLGKKRCTPQVLRRMACWTSPCSAPQPGSAASRDNRIAVNLSVGSQTTYSQNCTITR